MKRVALFTFIIAAMVCRYIAFAGGADTIFFNDKWAKCERSQAVYYRPPIKVLGKKRYEIKDYFTATRSLQMEGVFEDTTGDMLKEWAKYYYENGQLRDSSIYNKRRSNIASHYYYPNGRLAVNVVYKNQRINHTQCYSPEGKETKGCRAINYAAFPGGIEEYKKYINKNRQYPNYCWVNMIGGKASMKVSVDENGKVYAVKHLRAVHPLLQKEATRLMMGMPALIMPLDNKGQPAKTDLNLSVEFDEARAFYLFLNPLNLLCYFIIKS